uniref:Citrate transporter-like domain-containing protein n=1 Tax=Glossina austeni TaxID=7395 RepID=A0A1A9UPJ9_GLOAU
MTHRFSVSPANAVEFNFIGELRELDTTSATCFRTAKFCVDAMFDVKENGQRIPYPPGSDVVDAELTEGALQVWRALPERIRQDPSLASFRQEHERLHGYEPTDVDPLPSDDVDERSQNNGGVDADLVNDNDCLDHKPSDNVKKFNAFNITNEMGQMRILDGRDVENNNDDQQDDPEQSVTSKVKKYLIWFKISVLLVVWIVFTAFLMSTNEHVDVLKLISIPANGAKKSELPMQLCIDESPIYKKEGVIYAAIVLCGLYIMIIWEIVNRTFAAIIASTLSVGILAALNSRPSMVTIMGWIDVETLLLLFGMMILVAILSETGVFDYLAVYAYKITNGHVWPLINCLCLFTAVLSSFLDNVTTVLLMTPVTIRLCEVMSLNPVPILMCMVIYSNIGGALTPVGDPPNVIIASNNFISKNGVNFAVFTLHMLPGVILVMLQTYLQLRFKFGNISDLQFKESPDVEDLRHEIHVWKRAAASLSSYSKDEELVRQTLMKKVNRLKTSLKKKIATTIDPAIDYKQTLENLQAKYPIRNKTLLIKCSCALIFVISLFFLHSVPELQRLSLGWTALLGAIFLIILADIEDMEAILARVEWSTLLFFAALFILMEALSELGLIEWIGSMTENFILGVGEESRLMVAVLIILWVSTFTGNGTLIGASANVVCAGVAEQHGYKFTFLQFFKVGFPVMIGSILVSTAYLLVSHAIFSWH